MHGGSMRRIQERVLGYRTNVSISVSDIWLLGVCYKICLEDPSQEVVCSNGYAAFSEDFSSRILMTYRKGFVSIGDSKYSSDVNWGCMLRSSQMLVAQALLVHRLGRSWRKPLNQPFDKDYIEILHMFGDYEDSPFSIHNLVKAGESYALAPGSWVGPYAMCRTWETLVRCKIEKEGLQDKSFPMAIYVVSGDEDGERGGAPVLCIEDASRNCSEFSRNQAEWSPILLLVPLVLGLDKVNPRYLPTLAATFTFPQSLGILGGRPGASTYLIGVQDDKVFYLDPHDVQQIFLTRYYPLRPLCMTQAMIKWIQLILPILHHHSPPNHHHHYLQLCLLHLPAMNTLRTRHKMFISIREMTMIAIASHWVTSPVPAPLQQA